jgi:hypothetical protein
LSERASIPRLDRSRPRLTLELSNARRKLGEFTWHILAVLAAPAPNEASQE